MDKYDLVPNEFYIKDVKELDDGNRLYELIPIEEQRVCPYCGGYGNKHGVSSDRRVRDMPDGITLVGLVIHTNRYKCKLCDNTWSDTFESIDANGKITNRMRDYIKNKSLDTPFKTLADQLGIADTTVKRVFDDYIAELDEQRILYAPEVLGIDENHLMNQYRAVFVDVDKRKLLDILEKRSKVAVKEYITSLPDYDSNITVVTMDMWKPYRDAVKEVIPNAIIVVDHFHVIKEVNAALDIIRRELQKTVSKEERKYLKDSKYLLLTAQEKLDKVKERKRDALFEHFPMFERPYYVKELLREFYQQETREDAEVWYENIRAVIEDYEGLEAFENVLLTIDNWHDEIFNYFDYKYTNAITESINKQINEIGISGRGYSFDVLRAKAIYRSEIKKPTKFVFPE